MADGNWNLFRLSAGQAEISDFEFRILVKFMDTLNYEMRFNTIKLFGFGRLWIYKMEFKQENTLIF